MPRKRSAGLALPFTDDPLWYKDAVIYQLHIKSFFDANDDGIGDFAGLVQKLDYIAGLGVNTVWLLPFYPSPRRDDGYDIADYRGVHADYGSPRDLRRFIAEAHRRGLRVITELVINHTSDQHPWFQRARRARPGSSRRNFYVWSDSDQRYRGTRVIFVDTEKSNWSWDPVAQAYYWHRFYAHQPDLNFDNPQVLRAVLGILRFWLKLGVDGLRLDAVPYLIEREGTNNENLPETHGVLKRIRAELDAAFPGRMLLAEANQWPEDVQQYFGGKPATKAAGAGGKASAATADMLAAAAGRINPTADVASAAGVVGDECHMAFHFPLMPRMYMALAQEDRFPVTDILRQTPDIPPNCQWAIFLRNHDELTLEMVTDKERDYLWSQYAREARARLNIGIRRRLAPLVERDRRRIELLNSLLLSMPGTPVIYYGDELGMGDNIHLSDRDGVRTPMQWSLDRNGGFSRVDPARLVLPLIMDPVYGYQAVNVEAQARDPHSLLNWTRRMLGVRKQHKAFGRGTLKLLYPKNRRVLAYLRELRDGDSATDAILCVANVSRMAQAVELDLQQFASRVPVEMVGGTAFPPIGQLPYLLTLPPYGFYWFMLAATEKMPAWHTVPPEPLPEYHTLVLRQGVPDILRQPTRSLLENEILPAYLPVRRWFAAKDEKLQGVRIVEATELPGTARPILLLLLEARSGRSTSCYSLPLGVLPEEEMVTALPQQLSLARVRRGRSVSYLTDAFTLDAFARGVLDLLRADARVPSGEGELRFVRTAELDRITVKPAAEIRRLAAEQSNSSLVIGDQVILKLIRRVQRGLHPEAEMCRRLTEAGYRNVASLLGEVTRVAHDGTPEVLVLVQGFIHTQGDAWSWTQNMLERAIHDVALPERPAPRARAAALEEFKRFAHMLGQRLGQMHAVLAQPTDDPAFAPERATAETCRQWAAAAQASIAAALERLAQTRDWPDAEEKKLAEQLQKRGKALSATAERLAARGVGSLCTRAHGDLHLGQVLVSQDDAYFIDFEGEPGRPLAERRAKTSPLRDVASLLRSFDYAAAMAARTATSLTQDAALTARRRLLDAFRKLSVKACCVGYHTAAAPVPHQWQDSRAGLALLDLFMLEKAAYEICYEAANRPAWLGVPLRGLAALAARLQRA